MEAIKKKCEWCGETYALKDSTASFRQGLCSGECEAERNKAWDDCGKWCEEINQAWNTLLEEYKPADDECHPKNIRDEYRVFWHTGMSRMRYLAFKERYQKWKRNHCWKRSFWSWDNNESAGDSSSGGSGDGEGCAKVVVKLIGIAVVVWLAWIVIKSGWNWMFSSGGSGSSEVVSEAAIMEKWEEHLEKRREAFDDGKPEKEIEAKGLRNYTWEEWQEKFRKEHEAADKQNAEKKEVKDAEDTVSQKAKEIGGQALSAAKGLGDKAKEMWQSVTSSKDEKDTDAEARAKMEAEVRAKVEAEVRAKVAAEAAAKEKADPEARAKAEAEAKDKAEAEACAKEDAAKMADENIGSEQQNETDRKKASKDSSGIAVVVQGRGKTKDAALRYAIRQAVFKTVGTWVDSKVRMGENREAVIAQVATVTQDDVRKFEVLETDQEDGSLVLKVKVYVSKKKIAPKFAEIFPDVFGNVNE